VPPDELFAQFVYFFQKPFDFLSLFYPRAHFLDKFDRDVDRLGLCPDLAGQQMGRMPGRRIVGTTAVPASAFPGDFRKRTRNGNGTLAQLLRPGPDSLLDDIA